MTLSGRSDSAVNVRALDYLRAAGLRRSQIDQVPASIDAASDECEKRLPVTTECCESKRRLRMKQPDFELAAPGKLLVRFVNWRKADPSSGPLIASISAVTALASLVLSEAIF